MKYEPEISGLRSNQTSVVLLNSCLSQFDIRVGDSWVNYPHSDEQSDLILRHVEVSRSRDFEGHPVWEPLEEKDFIDALKWAINELVELKSKGA